MSKIYKAGVNAVLVHMETLFEEKTGYKGIGGKDLVMDVSDPAEQAKHARIYGSVVQVPLRLSNYPLLETMDHPGYPAYGPESSRTEFRKMRDIPQDVAVGDRVYFHFNTLLQRMSTPGSISVRDRQNFVHEYEDGSFLFKVNYNSIIATVKPDGRIIPIGGYVLCEPDRESWADALVPTYFDKAKKLKKPREHWIQIKVRPKNKSLRAFVRHIGTPMPGDEYDFKVGDKIIYRPKADWPVKIEGKEYFPIKFRHILAVVEEGDVKL